jgi:ribosomal protein L14
MQRQDGMRGLLFNLERNGVVLIDRKAQTVVTKIAILVDAMIAAKRYDWDKIEMKEGHPIPTTLLAIFPTMGAKATL